MKRISYTSIVLCLFSFCLISCTGTQNGQQTILNSDGTMTAVEAATVNLAVGIALSQHPEAILPAYGVSTALLAILDKNVEVSVPFIEKAVESEISKLNLDPLAKQSFNDLVVLVKAEITNILATQGVQATSKTVLIKQVLQIVQSASAARMHVIK